MIVVAALAVGVAVFVVMWWVRGDSGINWRASLDGIQQFGDQCEHGIAPYAGQSHDELRTTAVEMKPVLVPFRRNETRINVHEQAYLLLRCRANFRKLDGHAWAGVDLGRLFGTVSVYLNGKLKTIQSDNGTVTFPVLPDERREDVVLEVVAVPLPKLTAVGPATLIPFMYVTDRLQQWAIDRLLWANRIEGPALFLGFSLATFLVFGMSWILGIRYPDVSWMVVLASCLSLFLWFGYRPFSEGTQEWYIIQQIPRHATLLAMTMFVATFLRVEFKWLRPAWMFLGFTALSAISIFFVPRDILSVIMMPSRLPAIMAGIAMAGLGGIGWRHARSLEGVRRSRVRVMSASSGIAGLCLFVQAMVVVKTGIDLETFMFVGFMTMFSMFLAADLVVFKRQYFSERTRRLEEEGAKNQLESRLELGRAVQQLLLPKVMRGQTNGASYSFFYEPSQGMSGDWLAISRDASGATLFFVGDVVGKGPQAAISVAAIIAAINDCAAAGLAILPATRRINKMLFDLFEGQVTSTLAALSVPAAKGAPIETVNCGAFGWLQSSAEGTKLLRQPSDMLGIREAFDVQSTPVELASGQSLFTFTDGVVDGARAFRDLRKRVDEPRANPLRDEELFALAVETGKDHVHEDDKAFLVVRR